MENLSEETVFLDDHEGPTIEVEEESGEDNHDAVVSENGLESVAEDTLDDVEPVDWKTERQMYIDEIRKLTEVIQGKTKVKKKKTTAKTTKRGKPKKEERPIIPTGYIIEDPIITQRRMIEEQRRLMETQRMMQYPNYEMYMQEMRQPRFVYK